MKDKLVKTGHKKHYYRLRAFAFSLLALVGVGLAGSLPIYVTYQVSISQALAAEEEHEPVEEVTSAPLETEAL